MFSASNIAPHEDPNGKI